MVRSHVSTNILKLMLWQEFSEKLQSINARMMLIEAFCEIALKMILDGNLLLLLLVVYCCCLYTVVVVFLPALPVFLLLILLLGNLSPLMSLISKCEENEHALMALTKIGKNRKISSKTAAMIISILLDNLSNSAGFVLCFSSSSLS